MPPFLQPFGHGAKISNSGYPIFGSVVLLGSEQHDLCRLKKWDKSIICEPLSPCSFSNLWQTIENRQRSDLVWWRDWASDSDWWLWSTLRGQRLMSDCLRVAEKLDGFVQPNETLGTRLRAEHSEVWCAC